jgi:hypothetical protein
MKRDGTWDLFITLEIAEWYLELKKKGAYYWKINLEQSELLIKMLCNAYGIKEIPKLISDTAALKRKHCVGYYWARYPGNYEINVFPRCHMKTVIHEVYHHIDYMTKGYYNSSDYKNYAWQFAELYFQSLTKIKDLTSALIIRPKEPLLETSKSDTPKEKNEVSIVIWPEKEEEPKDEKIVVKLTKLKVKLSKKI